MERNDCQQRLEMELQKLRKENRQIRQNTVTCEVYRQMMAYRDAGIVRLKVERDKAEAERTALLEKLQELERWGILRNSSP
ncbi:hypothetical protein SAMN05216343_11416 [Oscillibacter sp. PC13]|uniref:hypothetical protein n=1 Tax=Oscillibacter sp. PC13 TaxID=1855299 RepID=UPI0008E80633|nr:hypothetical protein [Oscillibacter sp. PC13]SFP76678.1 hypothetical protein SAMN05216343_11416 [Oscillibacter sp. PC13]